MTLILSNQDVEQLLTMEGCMEALEYAYGELGAERAVMGPVIRVIAPVPAGVGQGGGRQRFYAYASMAAALPGWDVAANRQDSDLLDYEPRDRSSPRQNPGLAGRELLRLRAAP